MTTPIQHLPRSAAPSFSLPGIHFVGFASPSRGSHHLCTWQITVDAGLTSPQAHTLDRDEIFMVTEGVLSLHESAPQAGPGDTVVIPAGQPIRLSNPGDAPARAIVVLPADFHASTEDGTAIPTPPWAQ